MNHSNTTSNRLVIISTVGTSVFSNCDSKIEYAYNQQYGEDEFQPIDKELKQYQDHTAAELSVIGGERGFKTLVSQAQNFALGNFTKRRGSRGDLKWVYRADTLNELASAEITSILAIAKKHPEPEIHLELVATDTALSQAAAEVVQAFFQSPAIQERYPSIQSAIGIRVVEDLRVISSSQEESDNSAIQTTYLNGLHNLIKEILKGGGIFPKHNKWKKDTNDQLQKANQKPNTILNYILNFSGGYKAIVPILTLISQLKGIPINYLYDDSDQLIEIGNLPLQFDTQMVEIYHYYLNSKVLNSRDLNPEIIRKLQASHLLLPNTRKISPLGNLFQSFITQTASSKDTFGFSFELKCFQHFVQNPLKDYQGIPKTNIQYYQDTTPPYHIVSEIPEHEKGSNRYNTIEYDLIFQSPSGVGIAECKAFKQVNKKLQSNTATKLEIWKQHNPAQKIKEFILIIHRFYFNDLNNKRESLSELKHLLEEQGLELSVYHVDVPIKLDKATINYMEFLKTPEIELIDTLETLQLNS